MATPQPRSLLLSLFLTLSPVCLSGPPSLQDIHHSTRESDTFSVLAMLPRALQRTALRFAPHRPARGTGSASRGYLLANEYARV